MPVYVNIATAARKLGLRPRILVDAFYDGRLDNRHCEFVAGRRVIREDRLPAIAEALKRRQSGGSKP